MLLLLLIIVMMVDITTVVVVKFLLHHNLSYSCYAKDDLGSAFANEDEEHLRYAADDAGYCLVLWRS